MQKFEGDERRQAKEFKDIFELGGVPAFNQFYYFGIFIWKYLYKGFYNLGIMNLTSAASWLASALLIILALPLGLIFARIMTDKTFRYCT